MPRLDAIVRHWQQNPPLHKMIMGFMGIKPKAPAVVSASAGTPPRAHTVAELKALFPHGIMRG